MGRCLLNSKPAAPPDSMCEQQPPVQLLKRLHVTRGKPTQEKAVSGLPLPLCTLPHSHKCTRTHTRSHSHIRRKAVVLTPASVPSAFGTWPGGAICPWAPPLSPEQSVWLLPSTFLGMLTYLLPFLCIHPTSDLFLSPSLNRRPLVPSQNESRCY